MDDQRGSRPDDAQPVEGAEGVRIIGADEAAEAIERGEVAARRPEDEPRFGDRPSPPEGPRPALRFPLDANADPTRIERPPVDPAPDPVTGPVSLPHWTEPPTGEVPAVLIGDDQPFLQDDEDDLEVWSSFATSTPRWRDADDDWSTDDGFVEQLAGDGDEHRVGALVDPDAEPLHEEYFGFEDMAERVEERTGDAAPLASADASWEDDWSASDAGVAGDDVWVEDDQWVDEGYDQGYDDRVPVGGPGGGDGLYAPPRGGDRDMGSAWLVALGLGAVGLICLKIGAWTTVLLASVILVFAALEYFQVLKKVGWEAAHLVGLVAVLGLPWAIWWKGIVAFPVVIVIAVIATLAWYLAGAGGSDPRVLEGSGATILGIMWIGALGSSAAEMAIMPKGRSLLLVAIIATILYDAGGLFIGKAAGHRPLSAASPNKTVEGLLGGMALAFLFTLVLVGMLDVGPWTGPVAGLLLGLGAACAAPLGDLCQSLLKRDLGVKDMGTILPGHGGVLDRFDGLLFVLPTVLWLTVCLGSAVIR